MQNSLSDYNLWLVGLSFLVSLFGAGTGLLTSRRITKADGGVHAGWLVLSAVVLGGGAVWAMHFVGMLAYRPDMAITYDLNLTLVSLVVPIALFALGLWVTSRNPESILALLVAGSTLGLGVAAMHYMGMAAIRSEAVIGHDHTLMAVSVVIALVAACVALFILQRARGMLRAASAPVLAIAVCGMHYTGMAAMRLQPAIGQPDYFTGAVTGPQMLLLVVLAVTLIYVVSLSLVWGQEMREIRQQASVG